MFDVINISSLLNRLHEIMWNDNAPKERMDRKSGEFKQIQTKIDWLNFDSLADSMHFNLFIWNVFAQDKLWLNYISAALSHSENELWLWQQTKNIPNLLKQLYLSPLFHLSTSFALAASFWSFFFLSTVWNGNQPTYSSYLY